MTDPLVVWHDVECGAYVEDLPLWRELAAASGGPVLDVGAGTGRVTLDLAAAGHEVVALDLEPALLAELSRRAAARGLDVSTVAADARDFELHRAFSLILVPMQTLQIIGGTEGRARFLARAREHLAPGGLLAAALADLPDGLDVDDFTGLAPDMRDVEGTVYASRPVAIRDDGSGFTIERLRETVASDGAHTQEDNVIRLDRVDAELLAQEGAAAGLEPLDPRVIPESDEYVASTVAVLRG
ncbi:MAG: hypothetical protein QOH76_3171 [Thermoleophilaceae bacterium]|nr:hypothetical protein [Thermoleophilaceae bacterium]